MTRTLSRLAAVVATALVALVLATLPASAQYPPASDNGLSCTPENPAPGDTVTCVSGGYQPGSTATWTIVDSNGQTIANGTATADAEGTITFTYQVPTSAPAGTTYGAVLSGTAANGSPVTASDTFTSTQADGGDGDGAGDDDGDDDLPTTGVESTDIALVAGGALVLGVAMLAAARRRRGTVDA